MGRPPRREVWLTPLDADLLRALSTEGTVVAACRRLGVSRDRGVYRLRRLAGVAGGPVVRAERGGDARGSSRLTPLGYRLLRTGVGRLPRAASRRTTGIGAPVYVDGVWRARPEPHLAVDGDLALAVGFSAREGERVRVALDPDSVLVASERFPSSARNVLPATVLAVEGGPGPRRSLVARVGRRQRFRAAVTPGSVRDLGLARGRRVFLYVKATALRPVDGPRS